MENRSLHARSFQRLTKAFCLLLGMLLLSCTNYSQLTVVTELPKKLNENSGIEIASDSTLWFIEDNGNPDILFEVDLKGKILRELEVKNAKNKDWEDLAKDEKGNVYIGDFGNNGNKRKSLVIYKVSHKNLSKKHKVVAKRIDFSYPEQTKFPPKGKDLYYDAEAFFYFKSNLYILTKNRTNPFDGKVLIYKVPSKKGSYKATLVGSFTTCTDVKTCQVTAADISPNEKTIAVLGYGKLWLLTDFKGDAFAKGNVQTIDLGGRTQLEALSFVNDSTLFLSDEKMGPTGQKLYRYILK